MEGNKDSQGMEHKNRNLYGTAVRLHNKEEEEENIGMRKNMNEMAFLKISLM